MVCASGFVDSVPEVGGIADACFGDSGGPFTIRQQGRDVLEGVISWGRSCGKPQWPGVYAKVGRVLPWILENTQDSTFCEPDLN
jgi:secreted trypsin-like serine protease